MRAVASGMVFRTQRFFIVVVSVAIVAILIGAFGASATKSTTPVSVVDVPVKVISTTEGNVAYRVYGHGPPLVLIMGYAGNMEVWDPHFIDDLARHFRVVMFDNAGIGPTAVLRPLSIDTCLLYTSDAADEEDSVDL